MKVAYINLNVGSAIEYAGSIFKEWIVSVFPDTTEITLQGLDYYAELELIKPDLVILNSLYSSFSLQALKYITDNSIKLIVICHSWHELIESEWYDLYSKADKILVVATKPASIITPFDNKLLNYYYPTRDFFNIYTPWISRIHLFCYVGNILPHKFSMEFIQKVYGTPLQIMCYGKSWKDEEASFGWPFMENKKEYYELFHSCPNIIYKGLIPQDQVVAAFNDSKFFILPHNGAEPFLWTLLQSIFCGTIPLVVNDSKSSSFDPAWINWCDGFYYGTDDVDTMISNMLEMQNTGLRFEGVSLAISVMAKKKFSYDAIKQAFVTALNDVGGKT